MIFDTRATSGIGRFRVRAAKTDKPVPLFPRLRRRERLVEFAGNGRSDRASADWHAAGENLIRLDKQQIGRARSDIDEERAAVQVAVVVPKRVVKRHRCDVDNRCAQSGIFYAAVDLIEQIGLDRDQYHLDLLVRAAADELIIPNHFVDGKRDVLLRFKCDDLLDLFLFHRRQFDETREDRLSRDRIVDVAAFDLQLVHHLPHRRGDLRTADAFARGIDEQLAQNTALQHKPAMSLRAKLGHAQRL